ncbi:MAG TPA: phosphate signaling complex protein PhoU [Chloroflexaceae bacterium]|nr:phosphate signaling complex protein PhoU [Chloroflexaceae bacterium]
MMAELRERYRYELDELQRELLALGQLCDQAVRRAVWALRQGAVGEARAIIGDDDRIDDAADALTQHATRVIATQGPVAGELRLVSAFIQCADELERIGDYAEGIAKVVLRLDGAPAGGVPATLLAMAEDARAMLNKALDGLVARDPAINLRLKEEDDRVDAGYERLLGELTAQMERDPAMVQTGTYLLWVGHNLERIGDRSTNIGEYVEYIVRGVISTRG